MRSCAKFILALSCVYSNGCTGALKTTNPTVSPVNAAANVSPTSIPVTSPENSDDVQVETGTTKKDKPVSTEIAELVAVRAAEHGDSDRIVLEFKSGEVPSYSIEYQDRPAQQCGSGQYVKQKGTSVLHIRLDKTNAHHFRNYEIIALEPKISSQLPLLKDIALTCDFESQVELAFGVASKNEYRTSELKEPTRLVVDLKH